MTLLAMSQSRRRQWRVLLPAGLALTLSLTSDLTLYTVLPLYAAGLGFSLAAVGFLLSANRLIRLASNPLVGALAGRIPRRALVLAGLCGGVCSTLLYILTEAYWTFLLGRLLWGLSWSILYIGTYSIVLDITGAEDRGWGSGVLQSFFFLGVAGSPVLGGFLSSIMGFKEALTVCAALQGCGLTAALFFLPETNPVGNEPRSPAPFLESATAGLKSLMRKISRARLSAAREVLPANYLYALTLFSEGTILSTITLYLMQRYGEAIDLGGLVLPIGGAGGILIGLRAVVAAAAAPLAGRWSDRPGKRWIAARVGAACAIGGCLLLALNGNPAIILGGIGLASFGGGILAAVLPAVVSRSGVSGSFAIGMLFTSGDLGRAAAPLVTYLLLGRITLAHQYLFAASLLLTGLLAVWAAVRSPTPTAEKDPVLEDQRMDRE